ncbi:unnamed protein product [Dibothriocephalus latus]|uniref:LicD/FKTN/FKRP nucleotidyltransferase domain-containing protein n=1 Tax=Dibothriocephalus latus TaxID=60516 RepID=A0A3P7LPP9_DIBLA|nr:unnamed protein product [Dibothriocephalus latus]
MVARWHSRVALAALLIAFLLLLSQFYIKSNDPPIVHQLGIQGFIVDSGRTKVKRQKLPNLEQLDWPELEYLPLPLGVTRADQIPWGPQYSREQMRTQWKLFSIFEDVMEELGLSDKWMIWGGSLVGSFRHHDNIPWDDDLDVVVDFKVRDALWEKMLEMPPEIIIQQSHLRDKIYAKFIEPYNTAQDVEGSRNLSSWGWGWPFIDIGYYITNATHLEERAFYGPGHQTCAMSDVFPLIFRPFYKHWVPAPRNTFAAIMQPNIGQVDCLTSGWSHPFERHRQRQLKPCSELAHRYAFVEHSPLYNNSDQGSPSDLTWVRERLLLGHRSIHELRLVAPRHVAHVETYRMRVVTP